MAQKPSKDTPGKPTGADRTVRLPRKDLGLEKEEPTQALHIGQPLADSTLRLKRDGLSLEEPTVALRASEPAADSTMRLKRDELAYEEPTLSLQVSEPAADSTVRLKRDQLSLGEPTLALGIEGPRSEPSEPLQRPKLRTAMEVINEATQVNVAPAQHSVMMPDATDIPSWEETTLLFTPPSGGHTDRTLKLHRPLEPPPAPVDPSDSMDATFSHPPMPSSFLPPPGPTSAPGALDSDAEAEEETLILPDMHELDELPNAMRATMVMPVMEAPAPAVTLAQEATTIIQVEPMEPMEKTMVMPIMEAPAPAATMAQEATTIIHVEPVEPMEKTMVMPVLEAAGKTEFMAVPQEEASAYLTRQGQVPLHLPGTQEGPPPGSTQLMSESLVSKAIEATSLSAASDSLLAPVPPEVPVMDAGSPLMMGKEAPAASPPDTDATVNLSAGMAITPPTMLMPALPEAGPTVPVKLPVPAPKVTAPALAPSSPMQSPKPTAKGPARAPEARVQPIVPVPAPSVPGYPDRKDPLRPRPPVLASNTVSRPAPIEIQTSNPLSEKPTTSSSKVWIPVALGVLVLGGIGGYFAFSRTSSNPRRPVPKTESALAEPSLSVPPDMQGTLAKAKAGDGKSMHMLGVSFFYGLNVPQNKAEGLRWMRKAAAAGNDKAKSDLRQMETGLR